MSEPLNPLERFHTFYAVPGALPIHVLPWGDQNSPLTGLPNWEDFEQEIPELFRLASELRSSEQAFEALLRHTKNQGKEQGLTALILETIEQQNKKLDALLNYLLINEKKSDNQQALSLYTSAYGGGGVQFQTTEPTLQIGQFVQLKIFIQVPVTAIYCYAEVADIRQQASTTQEEASKVQTVTLAFARILESDQETLIRASLQAQTKLLKKRSTSPSE